MALIKPQFEADKADVGEKGVVRDRRVHEGVLEDITGFIPSLGWQVNGLDYSPIRGPEGNIEFLLDIVPNGKSDVNVNKNTINVIIDRAYDKFLKSSKGGL